MGCVSNERFVSAVGASLNVCIAVNRDHIYIVLTAFDEVITVSA